MRALLSSLIAVFALLSVNAHGGPVPVYAIKADDFGRGSPDAWDHFLRLTAQYNVPVYVGVVLDDIQQNSDAFAGMLAHIQRHPKYRLFYHGHTHNCGTDESGRKFGEFIAPLSAQEMLLDQGKAWLAAHGETQYVFNAPCGASDRRTALALANAGYHAWFYPKKDRDGLFEGCKIRYTAKVENPTFNPNFKTFGQQFKYLQSRGGEHLLQVHPGAWGGAKFAEFERILKSMTHHSASFNWVCKGA